MKHKRIVEKLECVMEECLRYIDDETKVKMIKEFGKWDDFEQKKFTDLIYIELIKQMKE